MLDSRGPTPAGLNLTLLNATIEVSQVEGEFQVAAVASASLLAPWFPNLEYFHLPADNSSFIEIGHRRDDTVRHAFRIYPLSSGREFFTGSRLIAIGRSPWGLQSNAGALVASGDYGTIGLRVGIKSLQVQTVRFFAPFAALTMPLGGSGVTFELRAARVDRGGANPPIPGSRAESEGTFGTTVGAARVRWSVGGPLRQHADLDRHGQGPERFDLLFFGGGSRRDGASVAAEAALAVTADERTDRRLLSPVTGMAGVFEAALRRGPGEYAAFARVRNYSYFATEYLNSVSVSPTSDPAEVLIGGAIEGDLGGAGFSLGAIGSVTFGLPGGDSSASQPTGSVVSGAVTARWDAVSFAGVVAQAGIEAGSSPFQGPLSSSADFRFFARTLVQARF